MRSACSACHARARLVRAQPLADLASLFLARAQPLLPLPPASQSRLPCTLQSLRRRHRRQFCSPQPWQLRARASSIRRRRHLTPRAGQRHQPLTARPNRPSLVPSPPAPPIRSHPLLQPMQRQHHARGLADWRTCSQPCLPLPTRLDRPAPPAVSNVEGMLGWTVPLLLDIPRRQLRLPGTDLATELDGLGFFYPTTKVRLFRLTHSPSPALFSGCSVLRASPPPPHTPFLCRACTSKADVYRPRVPFAAVS